MAKSQELRAKGHVTSPIAVIAVIARDRKSKCKTLPRINADDTDLEKQHHFTAEDAEDAKEENRIRRVTR